MELRKIASIQVPVGGVQNDILSIAKGDITLWRKVLLKNKLEASKFVEDVAPNVAKLIANRYTILFMPAYSVTLLSVAFQGEFKAGHLYYGRYEFRTPSVFSEGDKDFQLYANDLYEEGVATGKISFGYGNTHVHTNNIWHISSNVSKIDNPNTLTGWIYRTFVVQSTAEMYCRNHLVLDLTECFGAGNEPSKEWCDANIPFFEGEMYVNLPRNNEYRYIRLHITAIEGGLEPNIIQLSRLQFVDANSNVFTYSPYACAYCNIKGAPGEERYYELEQEADKLMGLITEKFCSVDFVAGTGADIIIDLQNNPLDIDTYNTYQFYTSGDTGQYYTRNPKNWTISLSKNKVDWIVVDNVVNANLPRQSSVLAYSKSFNINS